MVFSIYQPVSIDQSTISRRNFKRYKAGNAAEHTFRGDLQQLIESLVPNISATNEPKRQACGAPDYILTKKDIPVGFSEAKDIGDTDLSGAKKTGNKEQFDRYKSANLSKSSTERLIEVSVVTDNDIVVSQSRSFCHNLQRESTQLSIKDIEQLLKIDVVKRPFKPIQKSKARRKEFGDGYWFVTTYPLQDRTYNKIKAEVEKTKTDLAESTNIDEDDISFLRWRTNTTFSKTEKEGDQLILREFNHSKTQSYVRPPSAILRKGVVKGLMHFYHDDDLEEGIPWTKFKKLVKTIDLEIGIPKGTKAFSKNDASKLISLWK